MPLPEPKFPAHISPTSRSSFVICKQQWFWRYCMGVRPGGRSIHLEAGAAFADALEATRKAFYTQGYSEQDAFGIGMATLEDAYPKDADERIVGAKSLSGMAGALRYYFDTWPLASDYFTPMQFGPEHGVEFTFSIPLPIEHPDTGEPLVFEGRIDMIAQYKQDGVIWVIDDKTTSALGPSWRKQWELDSQITAYVWAAQQFKYPAAGAIIRGLGILKTMYKSDEVMCPRSQTFIDRWVRQLHHDIRGMIGVYNDAKQGFSDNAYPPSRALDKSLCGMYGGCSYVSACASDDPEPWLQSILTPLPDTPVEAGEFAEFFKS